MEHPIKMDDLGGPPLFLETPIYSTKERNILTMLELPPPLQKA